MKAFVIQHIHFEDLGNLSGALALAGFTIEYVNPMNMNHLDYIESVQCDLLIILGGPVGAYDVANYPYLEKEKRLIEKQIELNKGLIGICLGCQLIASVLGANVYAGNQKEIGWGKIQIDTLFSENSIYQNLNERYVLHWHGDTFDLPYGTERIASSQLYMNQGFRYGDRVLALQFHIEVQPHRIEEWLIGHACELSGVQTTSVQTIRSDTQVYANELQGIAHDMWLKWLSVFKLNYDVAK